jgi:hypothetical protein
LAIFSLCDKEINIIKSIQLASKSYTDFKNEFIKVADSLPFNDNIADFVDEIISFMGSTKDFNHPFADSDMIGSGANTKISYLVEDEEISVFALSEKFSLNENSRKAVYVYVNDQQLRNTIDYEFDSTFGFVRLLYNLKENDRIEIREYVSTSFNYIPPTPTKLGLYKKYQPRKYLDDRYLEPRIVIEGHDGSLITAFDDFKDDLILELELRIYNNIKQEYNEKIFDIDSVIGGYYKTALYGKENIDPIVNVEFLRWVSNTDLDYTNNEEYFRENETFTYTYSNMTDPIGKINLPGYWRGVYQWFYDTDRPHTAPWEMLGFSEKPQWWDKEYGNPPYTKFNLILWEDIRDGIIRQGPRKGRYDRYSRPSILDHIPVDGDGNLLSPLDSGLARDFTLINNKGSYGLGDISPVEYAWRSSSEWPYAVIKALCLLKPFEFITDNFDRSILTINQKGQTIVKSTKKFVKLEDFLVSDLANYQTSGLINFMVSYVKSQNKNPQEILSRLSKLDVNLSTRISGFVDQSEQKYLLDSKNPKSLSSSIFVPPENYDIIFNVSVPFSSLTYSGVIVEKVDRGWKIKGYNREDPYFYYQEPIRSTSDPLITVGGISEQFIEWIPNKEFFNGTLVRYQDRYYRSLKSHTSGINFETNLWKPLPVLPLVGGQQAFFRRTFDQFSKSKLIYGSILPNVQAVIDFLLGYESYLKSVGFNFDRYDAENQVVFNWATSCKEFMFWTKHNWEIGSLLTLSPSAEEISINLSLGVADNLFDRFYDYQILKGDGTPLLPNFLNVSRDFQKLSISTVNTNDGIYFIQVNFVLKEHVTIFTDRTVFNDVIYDKTTGYRQERIKSRGFRTVDWDGDYTSPGFLFDNVDIQTWQPFIDYRLGDIVSYKAYQYTSLENQFGSLEFDDTKWARLDFTPKKSLIPNFDYRINQFEDYYDLDADGLGSSQRELSRHVIGYQTRSYLENLAEDNVSQFNLYQGFIREKGTFNSITKVFEKLSKSRLNGVNLKEEWAFRVGRLGGSEQSYETEFRLYRSDFQVNPQPILINPPSLNIDQLDQILRVFQNDFTISSIPFNKDINPLIRYKLTSQTAGYVNFLHVDFFVKNRDDILNLDISKFKENKHIWVTFDKTSWNILRFNTVDLLRIRGISVDKINVTINFNRSHGLSVGEIIGIRGIKNLEGFYKIISANSRQIVIRISADADEPEFTQRTLPSVCLLTESRFLNYQAADQKSLSLLSDGAKLWIDENEKLNWEVVEKQSQFFGIPIVDYGIEIDITTGDLKNGNSVVFVKNLNQCISSMPSVDLVVVYTERSDGLRPFQILQPPEDVRESVRHRFGETLAISPDGKWLAVGSPRAGNIFTSYRGDYNGQQSYFAGDIVSEKGLLWRASVDIDPSIVGDGSTINFDTEDWSPVKIITSNEQGSSSGFANQGLVTMYEWQGQSWEEKYSFVSPSPKEWEGEQYGHSISIGTENGNYLMAISAPGSRQNTGRVYLYKYSPVVEDTSEVISYRVTVGPRTKPGQGSFRFYFDGIENPQLTFLVGNTYIFDQSDESNIYYPNIIDGAVLNLHPLGFSPDNINGTLDGGTIFQTGVIYFIDNAPVGREKYLADFDRATTRRIQIEITESTPSILYYHGVLTQFMGNSAVRKFPTIAREWSQFDNHNYQGIFDPSRSYPRDSIVWFNDYATLGGGKYYQAIVDIDGNDSTLSITNTELWIGLDPISTNSSLPTAVALDDDGSTLSIGLLSPTQLAELVKPGDKFGHVISMNRSGSILVVGAPLSDNQYFNNYRGIWNPNQEYRVNDVVGVIDDEITGKKSYRKLYDNRSDNDPLTDSSIEFVSKGDDPSGDPWEPVGDSTFESSGKIYIYQRSQFGTYDLKQIINAGSLSFISDLSSDEKISSGDQFGYSVDIDDSGTTIVVSSPLSDINLQNQGSAYIFKSETTTDLNFRLKQKLESYETYNNELFGSSVSITENTERIVIGAKNSPYRQPVIFDNGKSTFDKLRTKFSEDRGYPGQVYVFELKDKTYILSERLKADLRNNESFGYSIDATSNAILVGSPDYAEIINGSAVKVGITRLFKKDPLKNSWNQLSEETPIVDINLIKSISLYDDTRNIKLADIDIIDPNKLKILGLAEQEIEYKLPYDPAIYTNGNDQSVIDIDLAWFEKNVGKLWWDISKAKWLFAEQSDISYRVGTWNLLAPGASIDILEWVESSISPADWSRLADTTDGLSEGISGRPLYSNTYSVKRFFSNSTGQVIDTKYYFWVKDKKTIPNSSIIRRISADNVRNLIENPASEGIPILAIIDKDKFLAYNFSSAITSDSALLNIEYYNKNERYNPIHNEYQLLTEGDPDSRVPSQLELKWLDSLIGFNQIGNPVPDPSLSEKQRYGLSVRPSQTIFVDRYKALKLVIDKVNDLLLTRPFSDLINFRNLNSADTIPDIRNNEYDDVIDNFIDLAEVGTVKVRRAFLRANIINGEIDTVDILDSGSGYKVPPKVNIEGTGQGAKITVELDSQGRIIKTNVIQRGKRYSEAILSVRYFSILVKNDETTRNFWVIYSWDNERQIFFKNKIQAYDTKRYYSFVDWYENKVGPTTRINREILGLYLLPTINVAEGDIIRIKEYADGGWALLRKTAKGKGNILEDYELIGRNNGTIQIDQDIYNVKVYDALGTYDEQVYDIQPTQELRFIFQALKEDIFVDDLEVEWNKLFFTSIRYVFSEQLYIDWAFKTSFLDAIHNVGPLEEKINYKNDNLDSYKQYIEEVKPYRTTIREYTSRYEKLDVSRSALTDFDSPPLYSSVEGRILPVPITSQVIEQYPWKWWLDNNGYSVISIEIVDQGDDYISVPSVVINGDGTGTVAQAYIGNGKVTGIKIIEPGMGYRSAPRISLVGGNGTSDKIAKAVAIIGDTKVRTFDLSLKFDRITKNGLSKNKFYYQQIRADGLTSTFNLNYPPTRDRSKIKVFLNSDLLLNSEYTITFYVTKDSYSQLRGRLILKTTLTPNDLIEIEYEKNIEIFDAVDRIDGFYAPKSGMLGKEINQLMTGIDFGGVQIQGTTFDVSGGWDALPWFTDNWDSIEASTDFYYSIDYTSSVDSSEIFNAGAILKYETNLYRSKKRNVTNQGETVFPIISEDWQEYWEEFYITLPSVPTAEQEITIYLKRNGSQITSRIDSKFYRELSSLTDDSSENFKGNWRAFEDDGITSKIYQPGDIVRYKNKDYLVTNEVENIPPPINAIIPTFIGNGVNRNIQINPYLETFIGDTLIFRSIESDGTVKIDDVNIIDTNISGGSFSQIDQIYQSAAGVLAEEIVVEGGKFIGPDQVPSSEENLPGQIADSVSIKVFQVTNTGASPLQSKVFISDGTRRRYPIGLKILEPSSLMVYVDKIKFQTTADSTLLKYEIDYITNEIIFDLAPADGKIIEIISIGLGGVELLDYQEFLGDGDTRNFLTTADYNETQSVLVTVNGIQVDVSFVDSSDVLEIPKKTLIQFPFTPALSQAIKIICLGTAKDTDSSLQSLIRVNQQIYTFDGSSRSFPIDRFVNLTRGSANPSIIVEAGNRYLKGIDTIYKIYDGNNNVIEIGKDPIRPAGESLNQNIKVFINNIVRRFIIDYIYDGTLNSITISKNILSLGDEIKVEVDNIADYIIEGDNLIIKNISDLSIGDEISITWFSEYPTMNIISDQYSGGKSRYNLPRKPLNESYIWVFKNGERLISRFDYEISLSENSLFLKESTSTNDIIDVIMFGTDIKQEPIAFEIFKDILNVHRYNRFSKKRSISLARDLNYYDTEIIVTDASELFDPIPSKNLPGIISINNERINYFVKQGNTLTQLRRGVYGTAIAEMHNAGSEIIDVSPFEILPYNENQERFDKVYDNKKFRWKGEWKSNVLYTVGDTITIDEKTYVCITSHRSSISFENDYNLSDHLILSKWKISSENSVRGFIFEDLISLGNGNKNNILVKIERISEESAEVLIINVSEAEYSLSIENGTGILELSENIELKFNDLIIVDSLLIGPLDFVPTRSNKDFNYRNSIPNEYGPCDQFEIFVGGARLRKSSLTVYDEQLGVDSPLADKTLEAEFSVDGSEPFARLTNPAAIGTRITIIRRIGYIWYDRGENTASSGQTLRKNQSQILKFISQKSTELPE